MKNLIVLFVLITVIILSGCNQSTVVGPQGPPGPEGAANVKVYTFDGVDFTQTNQAGVVIDSISQDTVENSAWFIYLVNRSSQSYQSFLIPGYDYSFSYYIPKLIFISASQSVHYIIYRYSGSGAMFEEIKVVRIYGGVGVEGKPQLPDIDFSNYDAVKDYYGIKE